MPVVENVFAIEAYAVFGVVEYLQVAVSSVVNEIIVKVVPGERVPVGCPLEREGGVLSAEVRGWGYV